MIITMIALQLSLLMGLQADDTSEDLSVSEQALLQRYERESDSNFEQVTKDILASNPSAQLLMEVWSSPFPRSESADINGFLSPQTAKNHLALIREVALKLLAKFPAAGKTALVRYGEGNLFSLIPQPEREEIATIMITDIARKLRDGKDWSLAPEFIQLLRDIKSEGGVYSYNIRLAATEGNKVFDFEQSPPRWVDAKPLKDRMGESASRKAADNRVPAGRAARDESTLKPDEKRLVKSTDDTSGKTSPKVDTKAEQGFSAEDIQQAARLFPMIGLLSPGPNAANETVRNTLEQLGPVGSAQPLPTPRTLNPKVLEKFKDKALPPSRREALTAMENAKATIDSSAAKGGGRHTETTIFPRTSIGAAVKPVNVDLTPVARSPKRDSSTLPPSSEGRPELPSLSAKGAKVPSLPDEFKVAYEAIGKPVNLPDLFGKMDPGMLRAAIQSGQVPFDPAKFRAQLAELANTAAKPTIGPIGTAFQGVKNIVTGSLGAISRGAKKTKDAVVKTICNLGKLRS